MPVDLAGLLADLDAEHADVDQMLTDLTEKQWRTATPAQGWDVADSVSHLSYFDGTGLMALTDVAGFAASLETIYDVVLAGGDVALGREVSGQELLAHWRTGRTRLSAALAAADPAMRIAWYGPAMGVPSFVTARIMETWAHGQDIADALGHPPVATERLRHVCHIGVGARAYSYAINERTDPGDPVRVELLSPAGVSWAWGQQDAPDRVTGTALDFALHVTQRRNLLDTALLVTGPTATDWMSIAQSFAGGKGTGRDPLA
jgi:uncharacterized protein (TIGR03084 family)